MNLKETLRYMESQLLNENVVGDYNKLKKKRFDDDKIYKMLSQIYNTTEEQIKQIIAGQDEAQIQIKNGKNAEKNPQDYAGYGNLANNLQKMGANAINRQKLNRVEAVNSNGLKQYYNDMKTGEKLKNSIDSFNNQLSQQISNFENLKNQLTQISKQYKAQGKPTQNLDAALSEAEQSLAEVKQNDANSKNIFKGIGSLFKGVLNTVAGMAGNFIGGIASGMGGAR